MRAEPPLADDPERRLTLRQASQARDDFTQILDDLDLCASRPPTGGFLPDLEADSEASLLRAGPKDPASRIRPILRRLVPISSNASPNCWPLRDAQPVGVLPVEVRACTVARREQIERAKVGHRLFPLGFCAIYEFFQPLGVPPDYAGEGSGHYCMA